MPLKKKRSVIIRNSRLRRIRNNTREVILPACNAEQSRLQARRWKIKTHPKYFTEDSSELSDQVKELNDQFWAIERPLRASIIQCPTCFQTDKDIIYNPVRKEWYCVECYGILKAGFTKDGCPEQFP